MRLPGCQFRRVFVPKELPSSESLDGLSAVRYATTVMQRESWKWWKFGGLVFWLVGAVVVVHALGIHWSALTLEQVRTFLLSFGWWSPLIYGLLFAQPLIPLPVTVMAMAGGLAFGLWEGFSITVAAATIRACGQFIIARLLGREAIEAMLKGHLADVDRQIGRSAFRAVLWVRIVPNVPFDMQNLAFGVSQVPFGPFTLATLLGVTPTIWIWVYLGKTLTNISQVWHLMAILCGMIALWYVQHQVRRNRSM